MDAHRPPTAEGVASSRLAFRTVVEMSMIILYLTSAFRSGYGWSRLIFGLVVRPFLLLHPGRESRCQGIVLGT